MGFAESVDRILCSSMDGIEIEEEILTLLPATIPLRQDSLAELGNAWRRFSKARPEEAQFLFEEGSAFLRFIAASSAPYSPIIDNLTTYFTSPLLEEFADLDDPEDAPHLRIDLTSSQLFLSRSHEPSYAGSLANLTHLLYPKRLIVGNPAPLPPCILGAGFVVFAVSQSSANDLVLHHASLQTLSVEVGYRHTPFIEGIPLEHPSTKEFTEGTVLLSPAQPNIFEAEHFSYTLCLGSGVF